MKKRLVILYADDNPDDRELLRDALRDKDENHYLIETANGREVFFICNLQKASKTLLR
ncbi:MAG: hypothetical protein ACSLE0_04430 [Chitinophagaceae bacterium]